jgi:hypothetical protein
MRRERLKTKDESVACRGEKAEPWRFFFRSNRRGIGKTLDSP